MQALPDGRKNFRRASRKFPAAQSWEVKRRRVRPPSLPKMTSPHCKPILRLRRHGAAAVALGGLWLAFPAGAPAQSVPSPTNEKENKAAVENEPIRLEQFIISGTVAPRRQMDTPSSITTIDPDAIKIAVPRGAPELMKLVPGIYVESAGGEGRANVYTRGIPQSGGYTFAGLQEDGMGVFAETNTRGIAPDMLTRLTGLVSRVESVRGGTAGVFMNNAPGGIINFISREGTAVRQGELTLQTNDRHQIKASAWTTGPINAETTYAVALDYRRDDGQRDQGFTANDGGGISANLKRTFANDRGSLKLSAKWLDDRNAFYVPIPLRNASAPQSIPGGIDVRRGHIYSADLRRGVNLPNTPDGPRNPDLANGGHPRVIAVTADLDLKLVDGLRLRNLSRYSRVGWDSDILILASVATPLQSLANSIAAGAGTQFAAAQTGGNYRYRLSLPGTGEVVANPASLNGNGLGILQSEVVAEADVHCFQNDLRLLKSTGTGSGISAGLYTAWTNARAKAWGFTMVTEVHDLPRRLDFEYLDAASGASLGSGTYQGMRQASAAGSYRNNWTRLTNVAPYVNLEQRFGNWTFDGGVRRERKTDEVTNPVTASYNLNPTGQNNPALRNATFGNGTFYTMNYKLDATVWTAAANYKFTNHLSAYSRLVSAYRMPNTEDILTNARSRLTNPGPTNHIKQLEAGVKYSSRKVAVFASVIGSKLTNQLFSGVIAQPDGSLVSQNFFRDTDGVGVELETFITPIKPLTLHFVGTEQKVKFANNTYVSGIDSAGRPIALNINGNRPVRIPKTFFTASALYKLPEFSWGQLATNVDWEYVGDRKGDEANRLTLPAYSQIAVGLSLKSGRYSYRVQVQNLFDKIGFTEGDPRTALLIGDPNAAYLNARTIGPRSVTGSVTVSF